MRFDFASNMKDLERDLSNVALKQLPFATAVALNDVAADLMELNKRTMEREFDRPTRWTVNAFHFQRATKSRQFVVIHRKTAAARKDYLLRQAEGGARPQTGLERLLNTRLAYSGQVGFVVPTKHVKRDRHGNIQSGELQRILSGLRAQNDGAQNETAASAKRQRARAKSGKNAGRYFVMREGAKASPGVWMRKGKAAPVKVLAFTSKTPRYKKRFSFYPSMQRATAKLLPRAFAKAMAGAVATAR